MERQSVRGQAGLGFVVNSPAVEEAPAAVFRELVDAMRSGDPKSAVKQLLLAHRGMPYFDDLFDKAESIFHLKQYQERFADSRE